MASGNLSWREVYRYIGQRGRAEPDWLDEDALICSQDGEFSPVSDILESEDDPIMPDGLPYLQAAELPD